MKQLNIKLLDTIKDLSISCLFALQNDTDKKVSLHMTSNLLEALKRNISNVEADKSKLKLIILDELYNQEDQRLRMNHWYKHYVELGYQFYNVPKIAKYQVSIDIEPIDDKAKYHILVRLRNKQNTISRVVGVFCSMDEAKEFIDNYYQCDIVTIVYATNPETKSYITKLRKEKRDKEKLKRLLIEKS